jgi:hypothetical protein
MSNQLLLSGFGFNQDGPFLLLDDVRVRPTTRVPILLRGRVLTLTQTDPRFCVGRYSLKTFEAVPCPNRAVIENDKAIACGACLQANAFNPYFYNTQQLSPEQLAYNSQPHDVYLAHFGGGIIKVGISNSFRTQTRLLEQGARLAIVVCTMPDAQNARAIEDRARSVLRVPENVRGSMKRRLLNLEFDHSLARAELRQRFDRMRTEFHLAGIKGLAFEPDPFYFGGEQFHPPATDLCETEPKKISGRIVGMVGDLLIAIQQGRYFMLSLKPLMSHLVEVNDVEEVISYRPPIQTTLF